MPGSAGVVILCSVRGARRLAATAIDHGQGQSWPSPTHPRRRTTHRIRTTREKMNVMIRMTQSTTRGAAGLFARYAGGVALVLALFLAAANVGAQSDDRSDAAPEPVAELLEQAIGADCGGGDEAVADEAWVRTELFFGTARPDGTEVSEAEWNAFLDEEITPRFPDGLTVQTGRGQWFDGETIVEERSKILILFYPLEFASESSAEIEAIRAAYEEAFQQQSVLRSDDSRPVCVSF
jgi:hypothetical protein